MSWFSKGPSGSSSSKGRRSGEDAAAALRLEAWEAALKSSGLPDFVSDRLAAAAQGKTPWLSTMSPAELQLAGSHGLRPVAMVSGTCWMQVGTDSPRSFEIGLRTAFDRLRLEAEACGANAVVDVKLKSIRTAVSGRDFTMVGTAVRFEALPASQAPIIATTSALEFVRLLEADVVPVGVAVGTHSTWVDNTGLRFSPRTMGMNEPLTALGDFWQDVRRQAHQELRRDAAAQGNGVLAHTHFGQLLRVERDKMPDRYIARHVVIGTAVDARRGAPMPHDIESVVDMRDDESPLLQPAEQPQRGFTSNAHEEEIR